MTIRDQEIATFYPWNSEFYRNKLRCASSCGCIRHHRSGELLALGNHGISQRSSI